MRFTLFMVVMVALAITGIWLDSVLELSAWAVYQDDKWRLVGTGWSAISSAWPAAVAGLMVGTGLMAMVLLYLFRLAKDSDHERALNDARDKVTKARQIAESALKNAEAKIKPQRDAVARLEAQARETMAEAEKIKQRAIQFAQQAKDELEQAQKQAAFANTKKDRARGTAERLRRKLAKIENKALVGKYDQEGVKS